MGADERERDAVALVEAVCREIDERVEERLNLASLAAHAGVSPRHLQRLFAEHVGLTPRQYADARRRAVFQANVKAGASVTDALHEAGYTSSSRLYESAADKLGMTPGAYRRNGRGLRIGYSVARGPLGWVLVAATERGICSVALGDDADALFEGLRSEFGEAELARDDEGLGRQVEAVLELLAGAAPHEALSLDVAGTAFQMRVWEELRRIPRGETVSYGELAARIGRPTASRAVARACATNPVAVVTPCHRVVRGSGELGGYRWGIERKRRLLDAERSGAGG